MCRAVATCSMQLPTFPGHVGTAVERKSSLLGRQKSTASGCRNHARHWPKCRTPTRDTSWVDWSGTTPIARHADQCMHSIWDDGLRTAARVTQLAEVERAFAGNPPWLFFVFPREMSVSETGGTWPERAKLNTTCQAHFRFCLKRSALFCLAISHLTHPASSSVSLTTRSRNRSDLKSGVSSNLSTIPYLLAKLVTKNQPIAQTTPAVTPT